MRDNGPDFWTALLAGLVDGVTPSTWRQVALFFGLMVAALVVGSYWLL